MSVAKPTNSAGRPGLILNNKTRAQCFAVSGFMESGTAVSDFFVENCRGEVPLFQKELGGIFMGMMELLLIAVGLSMDAFAVAVCKGLAMPKLQIRNAVIIAFFFGGFQAFMPWLGWLLGSRFQEYIVDFDHWIAFCLLAFIGGQMIWESRKEKREVMEQEDALRLRQLFLLAVATSIDALAVGITFALLPGTNIGMSVLLIGMTTFLLSIAGVFVGFCFGSRYEKKAQIAGGMILIVLGIKILLEHLGVLSF